MQTYGFRCEKHLIEKVIKGLKWELYRYNYINQEFFSEGKRIIQVERGGGFRKILGLKKSVTVVIDYTDQGFDVSFSDELWADKAICGGVSLFMLWPLFFTAGIGALQQSELPNWILKCFNKHTNKLSEETKKEPITNLGLMG